MYPLENNYEWPVYNINGQDKRLIGQSWPMLSLFEQINRLAKVPTTVLIRGETGTGKELVAQAIHYNRPNGNGVKTPFVAVPCPGIPQDLLESMLFGHVKGAFTDAYTDKKGLFEEAEGGTIFLDEIGDMTPYLQAKILRVLQEREITRVGDTRTKKVNVRVIAATNQDLEAKIKNDDFRADLFYRINVAPIVIVPLRERKEDIAPTSKYFIERFNQTYGSSIEGISDSAIEKLSQHNWPGNVRELENIIERVYVFKKEGMIDVSDIFVDGNPLIVKADALATDPLVYAIRVQSLAQYIKLRLVELGRNQSWLAKQLDYTGAATVSNWINKKNFPDDRNLKKLIEVLQLNPLTVQALVDNRDKKPD